VVPIFWLRPKAAMCNLWAFFMSGKEIVLMGIGFDPEKRDIGNYLLESL
jgi:hypothetical protein